MLLGDKLQNIIVRQGEGAAPIKKTAHAPFLVVYGKPPARLGVPESFQL